MGLRKVIIAAAAVCSVAGTSVEATKAAEGSLQGKLVGSWRVIVVDNVSSTGERNHLYGDKPFGMATFDGSGHYSLLIMSEGRPRFSAGDKSKGTAEEYKSAIQGTNCHFGSYVVDDQKRSVTLHVEGATFTNWEGRDLTFPISVVADELTFTIPSPTTGGATVTGEVRVKRFQ
jgi:Lipocalin-like domain